MLIDADPRSGGLDLLLGAERTAGWRWPRLATARGHLGDLTGQLPTWKALICCPWPVANRRQAGSCRPSN